MQRGDIYSDGKHPWLITDVAKKTKKDEYRQCDESWNEAKVGQKFVYAVNVHNYCTTQGREEIETFRQRVKFLTKCQKCLCPNCDSYHPRWDYYYKKMNLERIKIDGE